MIWAHLLVATAQLLFGLFISYESATHIYRNRAVDRYDVATLAAVATMVAGAILHLSLLEVTAP